MGRGLKFLRQSLTYTQLKKNYSKSERMKLIDELSLVPGSFEDRKQIIN